MTTIITPPLISFRREESHTASGLLVAEQPPTFTLEVRVYKDGSFRLEECAPCEGAGEVAVADDTVHCRACAGHGFVLVPIGHGAA